MTATPARTASPARTGVVLRALGAAALAVSAYLHVDIARELPWVQDGQVTLMGLFMVQAVVAGLVALWVLVRGDLLAWLAVGAVGLGSLAALVASVYVRIPSVGPFPVIYEPFWYQDKYVAAVSAGVAAVVAAVALPALARNRRTGR